MLALAGLIIGGVPTLWVLPGLTGVVAGSVCAMAAYRHGWDSRGRAEAREPDAEPVQSNHMLYIELLPVDGDQQVKTRVACQAVTFVIPGNVVIASCSVCGVLDPQDV